ncbi:MAG: TAXI family TRAP transporter solute-binding subunit [Candidatus Competibacteraceae bacterium]
MLKERFTVILLFLLFSFAVGAQAAPIKEQAAEKSNRGVVGIVSGGVNGTYIRIAADLANVLDSDTLRVMPIVGKGSVQNIDDLLYLKGVDMAIVQSDVLEYLKRKGTYGAIDKRIHYITKLYNEEFHLLASPDIKGVSDLAGRKVNFDVEGSGTAITASLLFESLKIPVEATHYDQAAALEKLKTGEIAALAYVAGKPAPLFQKLPADTQLHFLPIEYTPQLLETYLPTRLSNSDYPTLIQPEQEVKTVAVGAVLAAYHWENNNPRHQKVAYFVDRFFEHFNDFQQPARHPKWREVSLSATLPGWTRFATAQNWLQRQ